MKYTAAVIAGLFVFAGLLLSTCEKRSTDVYAVVNSIEIRGRDFLTEENRKDEALLQKDLFALIEKIVIQTEAQKLQTTEEELLSFFDSLKTRDIPENKIAQVFKDEFKDQSLANQSREQMLTAVREKQYELARRKYIHELKMRSTILLVDDDGVFHSYKPVLEEAPKLQPKAPTKVYF